MARNKGPDLLDFTGQGQTGITLFKRFKVCNEVEFLLRPEHQINPVDVCNFSGFQLGIAPHNDHKCKGIGGHGPSHGVPTFGVSLVRDAAGVDDHDIGRFVDGYPGISSLTELTRKGGRLAEIEFATEGMEGRFLTACHGAKIRPFWCRHDLPFASFPTHATLKAYALLPCQTIRETNIDENICHDA
jgi:hypothetical protein